METKKTKYPGIRLKTKSGKYLATKSIKGKRFYKEFGTLKEAKTWMSIFLPGEAPSSSSSETRSLDDDPVFEEVVKEYFDNTADELTSYTIYKKKLRMKQFLPNLYNFRMSQLSRDVIKNHLKILKTLTSERSKRCNFDKELKDLRRIFTWYHDEVRSFDNPITKSTFKAGVIKKPPYKKRTLDLSSLKIFFDHLKEPYKSIAILQFLLGTRISEVCALNLSVVDFNKKVLILKDSIVWEKGSPKFCERNKTETTTFKEMTPLVESILLRALKTADPSSGLFFHRKNKPLRYNLILKHFNEALKSAGLNEYSGTHLLRHSMGAYSRKHGNLDIAQKMLSHQSSRQTESYAELDVDRDVSEIVLKAEKTLEEIIESMRPVATKH